MKAMLEISYHPLLVLVTTFVGLWLAARGGAFLRKRTRTPEQDLRDDFSAILAATLTLLGLLIGFSFSMATSRYDLRKTYEEAEANAIGTEYLRADLLPAADAAKVRPLLRDYLDQRIQFYSADDDDVLRKADARAAELQGQLWSAVQVPASAQPTPLMALVLAGMNDVLNSQGYTQAAFWNRIPTAAWRLMAAIAIFCNILMGFGSHGTKAASRLLLVLPLVVGVAFMLIADIDTPRHGLIRVTPQNLLSLAGTLH